MKKIYIPLLIAILSARWLEAQEPGENFAQPTNFYGRNINASGVTTKEYNASFSYAPDGKLQHFDFSDWLVSSEYNYEDDFLTRVLTQHNGMWPYYNDILRYTYEDGRIKTVAHLWDAMNANEYFQYEYYEDGRLYKKYYASYNPEDYYAYSIFEYENEGKTRIESYYGWASYQGTLVWGLGHRTVCQYDDSCVLRSEQTDNYDGSGEITSSKKRFMVTAPSANWKPRCP